MSEKAGMGRVKSTLQDPATPQAFGKMSPVLTGLLSYFHYIHLTTESKPSIWPRVTYYKWKISLKSCFIFTTPMNFVLYSLIYSSAF